MSVPQHVLFAVPTFPINGLHVGHAPTPHLCSPWPTPICTTPVYPTSNPSHIRGPCTTPVYPTSNPSHIRGPCTTPVYPTSNPSHIHGPRRLQGTGWELTYTKPDTENNPIINTGFCPTTGSTRHSQKTIFFLNYL
jgi:hypothetical protein